MRCGFCCSIPSMCTADVIRSATIGETSRFFVASQAKVLWPMAKRMVQRFGRRPADGNTGVINV